MVLIVGNVYTIYATNIDVDYVDILLSRDGGDTYEILESSVAVSHYTSGLQEIYEPFTYEWICTAPVSNKCYYKIIDSTDGEVFGLSEMFEIKFNIVHVTSTTDIARFYPKGISSYFDKYWR